MSTLNQALKQYLQNKLFSKPSNFVNHLGLCPMWEGVRQLGSDQQKFLDDMADLSINRAIVTARRAGGKTIAMAQYCTWSVSELPKILHEPYKVCVLGGKYEQAKALHSYCSGWFLSIPYLKKKLKKDPIKGYIVLKDGSEIRAVASSDRSVHGVHVDSIIVDEATDAKDQLIDESFGIISQSKYPRFILTSTPNRFSSYFVRTWRNAEKLGYRKYHFKLENSFWVNREELERKKEEWGEDSELYRIQCLGLPTPYSSIVFPPDLLHNNTPEEIPEIVKGTRIVMGIDFGFGPSPTAIVLCMLVGDIWWVIFAEKYIKRTPDWIQNRIVEIVKKFEIRDIFGDAQAKSEIMRLREVGVPVRSIAFQYKREVEMIPKAVGMLRNEKLKIPQPFDDLLREMGEMIYSTSKDGRVTSKRIGVDLVDALLLALTTQETEKSRFGIIVDSYG